MYNVRYQGGLDKVPSGNATKTYKFLLFLVCDGVEKSFSQASREGYASRGEGDSVTIRVPVVKLFTSRAGFGERKSFLSFYIDLRDKVKNINITGFSPKETHYLDCSGKLLTLEKVGDLVGKDTDSYMFYKRQSRLSVSELRKYITLTTVGAENSGLVRMVRI